MSRRRIAVLVSVSVIVVIVVAGALIAGTTRPLGSSSYSGLASSATGTGTSSTSTTSGLSTGITSSERTTSTSVSPVAQLSTGVIVPMFTNYTLTEVSELIQTKEANPSVPFLVVANPDDGPGTSENASYGAGLTQLESAGITVIGYVPTDWGNASVQTVESGISNFYNWYHPDGIYLDQMYNLEYSTDGTFIPTFYSTLTTYIKSLGMTEIFGNSGTDVPYYLIGTVSTIGFFENSYEPPLSIIGHWNGTYAKSNFAFFAYDVASLNPYYIAAASDDVAYLFLTSNEHPHPYNSLPSYFGQLVSDLGSLVPITVETAIPNGTIVDSGFNVTVTQPDGLANSGFTTSTFDVIKGSSVTITVQDNGGYVFDHWSDGDTSKTITLKATQATTLVADSSTSTTNASLVTVHTFEPNGVPVVGIYITASEGGTVVASGYTPFTFVATIGSDYAVDVQNYSTYSFYGWANTSLSSSDTVNITPTTDILLDAYVINQTSGGGSTSSSAAPVPHGASLVSLFVTATSVPLIPVKRMRRKGS